MTGRKLTVNYSGGVDVNNIDSNISYYTHLSLTILTLIDVKLRFPIISTTPVLLTAASFLDVEFLICHSVLL